MIFDTISFDVNDYKGAQVEGKTLYVYTASRTYDIDYKSKDEAILALGRLETQIPERAPSTDGVVHNSNKLVGFLDQIAANAKKAKETVLSKVDNTTALVVQIAAEAALEAAKGKAKGMIDDITVALKGATEDLDAVLRPEKPKPKAQATRNEPPRTTRFAYDADSDIERTETVNHDENAEDMRAAFVQSILGTPDEPNIEDMSDSELRAKVNEFIDMAVNEPEVRETFELMTRGLPPEAAEKAVEGLKEMILQLAYHQPQRTLSEIIRDFFNR